jgi:hypothetical protein
LLSESSTRTSPVFENQRPSASNGPAISWTLKSSKSLSLLSEYHRPIWPAAMVALKSQAARANDLSLFTPLWAVLRGNTELPELLPCLCLPERDFAESSGYYMSPVCRKTPDMEFVFILTQASHFLPALGV